MTIDLKKEVADFDTLKKRYFIRDGFVFTSWSDAPYHFDVLVVRSPEDADGNTQKFPLSIHSLKEHISLIAEQQIKRVQIIADDISFITECPSLKEIAVYPSNSTKKEFDYSPLYKLKKIESLSCQTVYGNKYQLSCSIDYSEIHGLKRLAVYSKEHLNYNLVKSIESLWISNIKEHQDFRQLSCSTELKELTVLQCGVNSLDGIERYHKLQSLDLSYNRALNDISKLETVADSLRLLSIESCPKIKDFSCLHKLTNLEHLSLYGNNSIPDLAFLEKMKNLKTFTFSIEVANGNLLPCLHLEYASCLKNKKWYNLKDKDLPKKIPLKPFKIR
ncbi:MAG: hypothetical protein IKJ88_04150 [Clostridia bacterium]|nr:hypothetical protein [Clostridia bacterium]